MIRHGMRFGNYHVGRWDRDRALAHLYVEDGRGEAWAVTAAKDGAWRIKHHPSRYDDDARVYAEGQADSMSTAKRAAKKAVTSLIKTIAKEEENA